MRRASTGTVAAASAACRSDRGLADGSPGVLVLGGGLAWTVGNRPDGSAGETPVPDIPGSVVPAGRFVPGGKVADELGMAVLAATTRSEAVPMKDRAPEAVASAEMCARSPALALDRTGTLACSSAAWPTGRVPTAHVALPGSGQIVNVGVPTNRPPPVHTDVPKPSNARHGPVRRATRAGPAGTTQTTLPVVAAQECRHPPPPHGASGRSTIERRRRISAMPPCSSGSTPRVPVSCDQAQRDASSATTCSPVRRQADSSVGS
jgi:hypothetical protein